MNRNAREIAFLALMAFEKKGEYLTRTLETWRQRETPSERDYHFSRELSFGTCRLALSLDYIAKALSEKGKLNLKLPEKILLRMALYQYVYMDRVPLYAITNETVELAKKYCHPQFIKFLNAVLRKVSLGIPEIPETELSSQFSYPSYFIDSLIADYGFHEAKKILEAQNQQASVMYRSRKSGEVKVLEGPLADIVDSPEYYIQNITPHTLVNRLAASPPKKVLDLCASPGGKLLSVHDLFPDSELFANDVSEEKLKTLTENCSKYGLSVHTSKSPGEKFCSQERFDLILLDVPCSNSGVLNKRPEARWRISQENLGVLEKLQLALIENALSLLSKEGEIWYLTCSILKRENERLMELVSKQWNLKIRKMETILPNKEGWDGGFASALQKR